MMRTPSHNNTLEAKKAQRLYFKQVRSNLSPEYRLQQSALTSKRLIHLLRSYERLTVSGFAALGSEIDLISFFYACAQYGWNLCLPCLNTQGNMDFIDIPRSNIEDASFKELPFVQNPLVKLDAHELKQQHLHIVSSSSIDVYLCPLLAFDAQGHRLGYGAGYYDRYLNKALQTHSELIACGIAFDEQYCDEVISEEHDKNLDLVMTPSTLYICSEKGKRFASSCAG